MKVIIKGIIKPNTIYFVKFSFKNVSVNKCTSSNFYMQDAFKFIEQFKKEKDIAIVMEILSEHGKECHIIENWKGMRIELFVDRNVKMMGAITDGVRIKPIRPEVKKKPIFSESNFESAKKANATIEMIEKSYILSNEIKTKYLNYEKL